MSIADDFEADGGSSSISRSSAEGTAADCAAPIDTLACAESAWPSSLQMQMSGYQSRLNIRGIRAKHTHHLIWNRVTRGFVVIFRTILSLTTLAGGFSFISSLSYSVN